MGLVEVFNVIRRNLALIAVAILVCILGALVYSLISRPVYTSEAQLLFSAEVPAGGTAQEQVSANNLVLQQASTYQTLATTPVVLQPVIDTLALGVPPAELVPMVEASLGTTSSVLSIVITADTPQEAVDLAAAITSQIASQVGNPDAAVQSPTALRTSVVQEATVPTSPSSPILPLNLALGLGLGLVLAFLAVVLREILNTRVRGVNDALRIVDKPVLGQINHIRTRRGESLLGGELTPSVAEQFRVLRLRLENVLTEQNAVVAVGSPGRNEGKSFVASNLALALASTGTRVILIDANLRTPALASAFELPTAGGVADVILGTTALKDLKVNLIWPEFSVVTTGAIEAGTGDWLASPKMAEIVRQCAAAADVVVIDAGSVLDSADGGTVARFASALLLVVRAGRTRTTKLRGSIEAVDGVLAGLIVNDIPLRGPDSRA